MKTKLVITVPGSVHQQSTDVMLFFRRAGHLFAVTRSIENPGFIPEKFIATHVKTGRAVPNTRCNQVKKCLALADKMLKKKDAEGRSYSSRITGFARQFPTINPLGKNGIPAK